MAVDVECNQLPTTLGQKTAPNSLSVVLASGTAISATVTGGATEAKQDTQNTKLDSLIAKDFATETTLGIIAGKDFATQSTLAALLTELQLKADLSQSQPVIVGALTPSYQEDLTVTTAVETITAPVGAKWCKIMTECSDGDMRVKIGGVASATSGMKFQDGRSEDFQAVGDISYRMEAGTGKIYVNFGV